MTAPTLPARRRARCTVPECRMRRLCFLVPIGSGLFAAICDECLVILAHEKDVA